jgi:outer membrane protein assembly factor BamB
VALDAATGSTVGAATPSAVGTSPTLAYGTVDSGSADGVACDVQARGAQTGQGLWYEDFCSQGEAPNNPAAASNGQLVHVSTGFRGLSPQTGTVLWTATPGPCCLYGAPAVAYGLVYGANIDRGGHLFALEGTTGARRWQRRIADLTLSSPAVANGVVYLGVGTGLLRAYDASTGALLWTYGIAPSDFDANPAISDGILYSATADGTVYAFGLP